MKAEIVRTFFEKEKLLTPDALRYLENKNLDDFLNGAYGTVIDVEDLMSFGDKIRIILNITEKKKEITTADIVKFYNSKYEKMKNIILSRVQKNFVSINKLDSYRAEVAIIGIVRDIKEEGDKKKLDLEDSTGSVTVVIDAEEAEDVELDDVIALQCTPAGNTAFGKKIFYPDVPLRQPTTGKGKCCFVTDLCLNEAPTKELERFLRWFSASDIKYIVFAGEIGDEKAFEALVDEHCSNKKVFASAFSSEEMPQLPKNFSSKNIVPLSNPAILEINGIKILTAGRFETKMLKKRHLGNIKPVMTEDVMALEELPDIILASGKEASVTNYKATTIIYGGSLLAEFRPVVVDFATRGTTQMKDEWA